MLQAAKRSGLCWLWLSIVVVALDRVTKLLAQKYLTLYEPLQVMPSFNLTLEYNKGAAFSFLDKASGWQTLFFGGLAVVISLVLIVWLAKNSHKQRWVCIALALIIGGALGNLWDRISYGHVIDFIDVYIKQLHWPVFNIADSAICIGAVMLIWDSLSKPIARAQ